MNFQQELHDVGLNETNAIVIGSGTMEALGIRESGDVDAIVAQPTYDALAATGEFCVQTVETIPLLRKGFLDIGCAWNVCGKQVSFADLWPQSFVQNGVRYVNLEVVLNQKRYTATLELSRSPKDARDVALIVAHLSQ